MVRMRKKDELTAHVTTYVLVNMFLVAIWAVTGVEFFWPVFPILGWGVGLALHAWDVYRRPPTEARIRHEMQRIHERDADAA
jgi:hypothetical protein